VLLAVEVADATVRFDRLVEAGLHARAGIPDFWLCLPVDGALEGVSRSRRRRGGLFRLSSGGT